MRSLFLFTSLLFAACVSKGSFVVPNNSVSAIKMASNGLSSASVINATITATVATGAMTVSLKTLAGANASAGDPIKVGFRSNTAATGSYSVLTLAAAASVVIPSGATLGITSGVASDLFVYLQNNSGSIQVCVSGKGTYEEGTVQTSTAISGVSPSSTALYCTAGVNGAVRFVGRFTSTQASAGTWASNPTEISVLPVSKSGSVITKKTNMLYFSANFGKGTQTVNCDVDPCTLFGSSGDIEMGRTSQGEYAIRVASGICGDVLSCQGNGPNWQTGTASDWSFGVMTNPAASATAYQMKFITNGGNVIDVAGSITCSCKAP